MNDQSDRCCVDYQFHYSDGTLFPKTVAVIEPWDIHNLDFSGTTIIEGDKTRTIAAGPDEMGLVYFEDGTEAFLHCCHFEGQQTPEGRQAVYEADRAAREAAGLILSVTR